MQNAFISRLLVEATGAATAPAQAQASVPKPAPDADRAPLGSLARPVICRGTRMPTVCVWDTCDGDLVATGRDLYQCGDCGTWFKLAPPEDLGVYVGDLASVGDDPTPGHDLRTVAASYGPCENPPGETPEVRDLTIQFLADILAALDAIPGESQDAEPAKAVGQAKIIESCPECGGALAVELGDIHEWEYCAANPRHFVREGPPIAHPPGACSMGSPLRAL